MEAPSHAAEVTASAVRPGDILIGTSRGMSRVIGEVYPSAVMPGCTAIETEHGAIYTDSDETMFVFSNGINGLWHNDVIQFPRLLAEIVATQDSLDMEAIAESMDLTVDQVDELFDRAQMEWERIKG